jgi:dynein assembly factor with WDR repeat domains 1
MVATGSMDNTARLWDVETGECLHTLLGHTAEIVSLNFDTQGDRIITGSFDHTVKIWDVRMGRCIHTLAGHHGEISSTQVREQSAFSWSPCLNFLLNYSLNGFLFPLPFSHVMYRCLVSFWVNLQFNYGADLCISGSIDRTCKVWDVASGQCIHTLRGHNDEILDVCFNTTGSKLVSASADGTSRVFNTMTGACQAILVGHEGEISKVCFNPQGSRILTSSSDKTGRLWEVETGGCMQVRVRGVRSVCFSMF